jgi:N-acetylglucosamine-6-phosphate deacetylase
MGIDQIAAVQSASVNPAKAMGIFGEVGSLDPGKQANLILVNSNWEIQAVYCGGQRIAPSKGAS